MMEKKIHRKKYKCLSKSRLLLEWTEASLIKKYFIDSYIIYWRIVRIKGALAACGSEVRQGLISKPPRRV